MNELNCVYMTAPSLGWSISNGGYEGRVFYDGEYGRMSSPVSKDGNVILGTKGGYETHKVDLSSLELMSENEDGSNSYRVNMELTRMDSFIPYGNGISITFFPKLSSNILY